LHIAFGCTSPLVAHRLWLHIAFGCTSPLVAHRLWLHIAFGCTSPLVAQWPLFYRSDLSATKGVFLPNC